TIILTFFFQAEDGIRDSSVTGVQTCALPISERVHRQDVPGDAQQPESGQRDPVPGEREIALEDRERRQDGGRDREDRPDGRFQRSEERRVGKGGRQGGGWGDERRGR